MSASGTLLVSTSVDSFPETELAAAMRLAAYGFLEGAVEQDGPRDEDAEDAVQFLLAFRVSADPRQPLVTDLPLRMQGAMAEHDLVLQRRHGRTSIILASTDLTNAVKLSVTHRQDLSDVPDGHVTRQMLHDHAMDLSRLLEGHVGTHDPQAQRGLHELEAIARDVSALAYAEHGLPAAVTVLSQDDGSEIIAMAVLDDDRNLHLRPSLARRMAEKVRIQRTLSAHHGGSLTLMSHGAPLTWDNLLQGSITRRSASVDAIEPGPVDVMRTLARWQDGPHPHTSIDDDPKWSDNPE